jgi:hypothetical protein
MTIDPLNEPLVSLLINEFIRIVVIILIIMLSEVHTQSDRVDMPANDLIIIHFEQRRKNGSTDHTLWLLEKCQIVGAELREGKHERGGI